MDAQPHRSSTRRRTTAKLCPVHPEFGINAALAQVLDVVGARLLATIAIGAFVSIAYCVGHSL